MDSAAVSDWSEIFSVRQFGPNELEDLASSQLEHALDARRRGLKIYESLKSLNEVIGTQYGDRVLFELVQNAHDAHRPSDHGEVAIRLVLEDEQRGTLFVANRGRSFTFSNLDAIRNIGTSDKEIGEGIGNKGLGFRSVEALTDDPRIYSQTEGSTKDRFHGYCFRFASQEEIEGNLEQLGAPAGVAKQVASNISRYLVPLPLLNQPEEVVGFAEAGFATVVELPLHSAEAVVLAREQVSALASPDAPLLLFLERLASLEIEIRDGSERLKHIRLTRKARQLGAAEASRSIALYEVELDTGAPLLVVRKVLPKGAVNKAVEESIPFAQELKRWREWKGEAVVSAAVGLRDGAVREARLFNFLPMDEKAVAPIHGFIDAPFFADIDRRSIKPDLPLNRYLLDSAAEACAAAAQMITQKNLPIPPESVVDLVTWAQPHVKKIVNGFTRLNKEYTSAEVWPVVAEGGPRWSSLDFLYAWPDVATKIIKPRRLAKEVDAAILPGQLGSDRLLRIKRLASNVSKSVELSTPTLCEWVVGVAHALAGAKRLPKSRWRDFYDDVVAVFSASSADLAGLQGTRFLVSNDGRLLDATASGSESVEPVFVRPGGTKGRRSSGPPKPPGSLSRRLKFLDDQVSLSEETLRAFEKAGLVRRYDALEVLAGLPANLGRQATANQRRDALTWAFKVWRTTGGGRAVDTALRKASLYVPASSGWVPATEAFFSSSWTSAGKVLEPFLRESADHSSDCTYQRERLLSDYAAWPAASAHDKKSDWSRFLEVLKVRDGLHPIAGKLRRSGTPNNYWHGLFANGSPELGLGSAWTAVAGKKRLSYPQTEYSLEGECWRFPGQLEHAALPRAAREMFSELIVAYLKDMDDRHFNFNVRHRRDFEHVKLPTPLQVFLRHAPWMLSYRREEAVLRRPDETWSTQVARQVPPRFVDRFTAEPGFRASTPPILFDARVGLRDWTAPDTAPDRLAALASALSDLSAAERRDLRDQLRRAWADIAEGSFALPADAALVVERATGLEVCTACPERRPVVYLTSERQGFAARALIDQGAAVLDLGAADTTTISALLEKTGGLSPRPIDAGDVRLIVDGTSFEPSRSDPLLAIGSVSWLSDAAVLAHEFLGDPLELRTLPPETLDQRIRQIRIRHCDHFSVVIGDNQVSAQGHERAHPFPDSQLPTLVVAGANEIDIDVLVEAAPALTKLVGARRNTLETMLTRLIRHGFKGGSTGPTDQQYARAIQRETAIVRDHFAAMRGGVERRFRAILPIVHLLAGVEAAERLSQAFARLGPLLQLRDWLEKTLGPERAETIWAAIDDTDDQATLRRRLGLDFGAYNAVLRQLGYPPLNDEDDWRRLFEVYLNELRPSLVDRVRRRYLQAYQRGDSLSHYVEHKSLSFVAFDAEWPLAMETLDRSFVEQHALRAAGTVLGPDDERIELPDLRRVTTANRKVALAAHSRMASVVRAWCRTNARKQPDLMDPSDPQPLVRALEQAGLIDFERLLPDQLPSMCKRIEAWPVDMAATFDLEKLSLKEADLDFEEREAREARRRAEVARRSIMFGDSCLDTGATDFPLTFAELADEALAAGPGWLERSRPARLQIQEQPEDRDGRRGRGGVSKGGKRSEQPPEPIRRAMGMVSEFLAREYLMRRHPREMTDRCWVSENRGPFCSDGEKGNDSLGYDFRVVTQRNEWLYEVKSALDEGGEFELTARELEVAGSAALDRKRRYRILYVPFVFDPDRWRVLTLQNPVGESTRNRFRVIRTGSVRYGFSIKS